MKKNNNNSDVLLLICELLQQLGVTMNYKGFLQTTYAVYYSLIDVRRLNSITKRVYPLVAKRCTTTVGAVERNIRMIVDIVWRNYRDEFEDVLKIKLKYKPGNVQFIAIVTMRILSILRKK